MPRRRAATAWTFASLLALSGCGWAPLYANSETGPAAAELRAIRVEPIPERIGQRLEMSLRNAFNPTGEPTNERYRLKTILTVSLSDLGLQSQGTAVLGRLDVFATYYLIDLKSGNNLLVNTVHSQNSFPLNPNQYSTVVGEDDVGVRSVVELSREITARLTLFMMHRLAEQATKPS
jgi:LPS-assembly lipoprotein